MYESESDFMLILSECSVYLWSCRGGRGFPGLTDGRSRDAGKAQIENKCV